MTRQVEVADHVLVIARVTGVRVPSAGGLEGPLLYAGRSYRSLADREGAAGGNAGRERGTGVIAELSGPPGRG